MEDKKPLNDSREFLLGLSEVLQDTGPMSTEDLRASLEKRGVKVDAFLARARTIIDAEADTRREERRRLAMKQRAEFVSAFDRLTVSLPKTTNGLRQLINEFVAGAYGTGLQQAAMVQWRKYEKATFDDLRILAEDLLKLKAMGKDGGGKSGKAT